MLVLLFKSHVKDYDRKGPRGVPVHVNAHERRTPPVVSFRSGASAPADMRGYIAAGQPFGITLAEVRPNSASWDMACEYARRGGSVFVDTGAFTAFTKGEPVDWDRVVHTQLEMARAVGPGAQLHIVAPDVVGDQDASLAILTKYAEQMRALIAAGHILLVPVQKGKRSPYEAWRAAIRILGTTRFTPSVPSNKVAFDLEDLDGFFSGPHKPRSVHLLGVAGNKAKLAAMARVIHTRAPRCVITSDANRLRAMVGEGRPVTRAGPGWAEFMRQAGELLLTDPAQRAAWAEQHQRAAGSIPRSLSIMEAENRGVSQRDLFAAPPATKEVA